MGIRLLNRRTATRLLNRRTATRLLNRRTAFAVDASTARVPADPAASLRRTVVALRRRLTQRDLTVVYANETPGHPQRPRGRPPWRDLARDYLTALRTLLPRSRPARTAAPLAAPAAPSATVSERPAGSAPCPDPPPHRKQAPGATP